MIRIMICAILLYFLFQKIHFQEIILYFRKISLLSLILIVILTILSQLFLVFRWRLILIELKVNRKFTELIKFYFIGLFFNTFMPSTVGGDVVKGHLLFKGSGKIQLSYFSIFTDRLTGVFSLLLSALIACFFANFNYKGYPIRTLLLLSLLLFISICFISTSKVFKKMIIPLRKKLRILYIMANSFLYSVKFMIKNKTTLSLCVFYSLICYFTTVIIHYIITVEFHHPVNIGSIFIYLSLIGIATMIPLSINGIGIRDFLYVYFFSFNGFNSNMSVSMCWIVFTVFLAVSYIPGAYFIFFQKGYSVKELTKF